MSEHHRDRRADDLLLRYFEGLIAESAQGIRASRTVAAAEDSVLEMERKTRAAESAVYMALHHLVWLQAEGEPVPDSALEAYEDARHQLEELRAQQRVRSLAPFRPRPGGR